MEPGFVRGQSDNLPKIDSVSLASYFAKNSDYISAETRGLKASRSTRDSYGDNAIGYVQLKREGEICTVKARISPEHKVRKSPYHVTIIYNEKTGVLQSVKCLNCAASAGGCKYAIAVLFWVHRRSEEPALTSVKCYWKKSALSSVGTSKKFIKSKELANKVDQINKTTDGSFLQTLLHESRKRKLETQLSSYFFHVSDVIQLSIHRLLYSFKNAAKMQHCSENMTSEACEEVCQLTADQASCPLWHGMRYGRITASKVDEVVHCNTPDGSLVEMILGSHSQIDSTAMKRGRRLEPLVLQKLQATIKIKFKKCGMLLKNDLPVFSASPDGISDDYVVEIKCPINDKTFSTYFTSDEKPARRYMSQIQMQMHFANRKKGIFCIAHADFEASESFKIMYVNYDEEYCKYLFEKSFLFWQNAIFPKRSV